jgi:hypothetical protein
MAMSTQDVRMRRKRSQLRSRLQLCKKVGSVPLRSFNDVDASQKRSDGPLLYVAHDSSLRDHNGKDVT